MFPPIPNHPVNPLSPPPHSLRRRLVGTLLLALLAAGGQLVSASGLSSSPELPLLLPVLLLMNAATWEGWRTENGSGHLIELIAGLLFPWCMLAVMLYCLESESEYREALKRYAALCFTFHALVGLALFLREGFRLRGCGPAATRQSVVTSMRQYLYPVGFLGLALPCADAVCPLLCVGLLYRFWKALVGNATMGTALAGLCLLGLDALCALLTGQKYGLTWLFGFDDQALFSAGALLIFLALLWPCVKLVRYFRRKLGGGESPLPVLGFLGDILAIPALPCALAAILIAIACILFGVGGALSF